MLKFFPDDAPAEPSNNLKAMRVSDLLRMSTGHQTEPPRKPDEVVDEDVPRAPGPVQAGHPLPLQHLGDLHALGHRPEGDGPDRARLPAARASSSRWASRTRPGRASPQGITTGGYGLSVRTEDIARFGQLYLQKGKWQGKQLVPEAWVEAATARQTSNGSNPKSDWDQGYGYQFWRCRHGAYRGDGAFGQYCVVLPEQDAVLAITSGVRDMQAVLNLVWDKLLPAMKSSSLPADDAAASKLDARLKGLTVRPIEGTASPAAPRDWARSTRSPRTTGSSNRSRWRARATTVP